MNPFDQFDPQPTRGPIYGPAPIPKQPTAQTGAQAQGDVLDNQKTALQIEVERLKIEEERRKAEEEARKLATMQAAQGDAVDKLTRVIGQLDNIYADSSDNGGLGETGFSGGAMRAFGPSGTAAYDLAGQVRTIDANLAFDRLQQMRDASATGGALGAITKEELDLLKSSVANLDPNLSQDEFIRQIGIAKGAYLDTLSKLDQKKAAEILNRGNPVMDAYGNLTYDKRGQEAVGNTNPPTPPTGPGFWKQIGMGAGDLVEGVGDVAGLVANPLNAGVNAMFGTNLSTDMGQNLRDMSGLPQSGDNIFSQANKFGASALAGGGLARTMGQVMTPGTAQAVAQTLGRTPVRDTAAGAGAGAGAYLGEKSGIPGGEVAGMFLGGLGGYGAASALAPSAARAAGVGVARQPNALMQSADELGIQMMPADVGGTGTRFASSVVDRTLGAIPMAEGRVASTQSARNATNRVADDIGNYSPDPVGAGQAVQRGSKEFIKTSLGRSEQLFDRVAVNPETRVQLSQTRNTLFELTQGMQSNPALSRIWTNYPRLKETLDAIVPAPEVVRDTSGGIARAPRQEMVGGELSWQDMKRFRSIVGEIIGQPGLSRDGSDIAALRRLYGALTTDMEATARQAGPRALTEWKRANQYFRGRQDRIDNVLTSVLGDVTTKSDEAAFQQINRWAQTKGGDSRSLARTMRSLPRDEASVVQATILQRLGLAKAGRQGADGDEFSPAEFVTQWNNLSTRAKSTLFPQKQHRDSINKLVTVMDSMKQSGEFTNASKTSIGTNIALTGAATYANPILGTLYALGQFGAGKLLASPGFARILASSSRLPPQQQARRLTQELGVLAKSEPLIANDIQAVQQFISQGMAQSPGRLAAEPQRQEENYGGSPPPQY